jgi:hypothetical protein
MSNSNANATANNANFHKIQGRYLRIRPGTDISINTPVLNLNIGAAFLIETDSRDPVYDLNIDAVRAHLKKHHHLEFESAEHIDDYVPVGQVDRRYRGDKDSSIDPNISIILANTRVVPTTRSYRQLKSSIWVAETTLNGTKMRSLGTVYSIEKPNYATPIFPISLMKKVSSSEPNYDLYSDRSYGRRVLNETALNIDKRNRRMIDSTGDISLIPSNVFIPLTPDELYGADMSGLDERFNRKVYFTTQGTIANDPACVKPKNNRMKNHLMECNGIATQIDPNESGDLNMNARVDNRINSNNSDYKVENFNNMRQLGPNTPPDNSEYKILSDREKQIILREKDEPWFTNPEIVGDIAIYDNPHTVTGHHDTLEMTDSEIYDAIEELRPKGSLGALKGDSETLVLIGTFDGDTDEVNMPFSSDCKVDPVIGYSRYDKLQRCLNREGRNGMGKLLEPFEAQEPNYNNYIMGIICIIILILLVYKFRQ